VEVDNYRVQLENFYGPLDLLLHLIRQEEVDIYDIPISRITKQYIAYLEMMKKLEINLAGEFMVMAASLMEVKSRTLVPREQVEEEEEGDPRLELVRKLLEYKKFKELAKKLLTLADQESLRYPRVPPDIEFEKPEDEDDTIELNLWQLCSYFAKVQKQTLLDMPVSILYEDIPIETIMDDIVRRFSSGGRLSLWDMLGHEKGNKVRLVSHFLAVLELAKQRRIRLVQTDDFTDIDMTLLPNAAADVPAGGNGGPSLTEAQAALGAEVTPVKCACQADAVPAGDAAAAAVDPPAGTVAPTAAEPSAATETPTDRPVV
jgi:segregation and condensation protein A